MKFVVTNTSDVSVTVDGLGVLEPGASLDVDEDMQAAYLHLRGLPLALAGLPAGVEKVVDLGVLEVKPAEDVKTEEA